MNKRRFKLEGLFWAESCKKNWGTYRKQTLWSSNQDADCVVTALEGE